MNWIDIASIVFICVTMNHLGLVKAIEKVTEHRLPILNCAKCSSFWCTLLYMLIVSKQIILSLAISLLISYIALWLELLEGYIDTLYMTLYEKIITDSEDNETAAGLERGYSDGSVSKL